MQASTKEYYFRCAYPRAAAATPATVSTATRPDHVAAQGALVSKAQFKTHLPLPVLLLFNDVCYLRVHLRQRRIKQLGPLQGSHRQ